MGVEQNCIWFICCDRTLMSLLSVPLLQNNIFPAISLGLNFSVNMLELIRFQ